MPLSLRSLAVWPCALVALGAAWLASPAEARKTVCSITVNSPDEKEAFRRSLGPGYDFVELVEHGRPDWLESACRSGVRCDVLVISGHYDGGNEFFSDRIEAREFLPVDEMERVSCSDSCPGLFSQLEEVYLFGCNTLNASPNASPSAEVERSFARAGHSRREAERMTRDLALRHAESSRDRMRLIFKGVPAIYGFSSVAPLGPAAASLLRRHFAVNGTGDVGSGRVSGRLLAQFSAHAMTVTAGLNDREPLARHRADVCQFADARLGPAQQLEFVHRLLDREAAEARMFLPRLERLAAAIDPREREAPDVQRALSAIAGDAIARARYLDFARDADSPAVRARMVALAGRLGWLTPEGERAELVRMFVEILARDAITPADVALACELNPDGDLDFPPAAGGEAMGVPRAALLACLGDQAAHRRMVRALTSSDEGDVRFAQVYLRHRPLGDHGELRTVAAEVARMSGGQAQLRALHALARLELSDPDSLAALVRLYPVAQSAEVQTAIASILLRAEYRELASPELVETLRTHRLKGTGGVDAIDVLLRRMEGSATPPS